MAKQALVTNPEYEHLMLEVQTLEKNASNLILEHDELLYHICKNIAAEYMVKVGALEYKVYEIQCNILRLKRKIEMVQTAINRQELYLLSDIEHQLDAEFAEYIKNLKEKMDQVQNALDRKLNREAMSESDAAELKRLYVKIVKMSHPDLAVNQTRKKHELFLKAVAAYEKADLETMRAISTLLDDAASLNYLPGTPGVLEELVKKKEMLEFKCEQTKKEIEQIKNTYPYNKKDFLDDPKQVQARTDELNHIFALYQKELKDIEERLTVITGENRE